MDHQKVTQVLKQIFDMNGGQIIQNKSRFKGAVFDLLDEWRYKDERTVLMHAIECSAIPRLLSEQQITGDVAVWAVNEICNECRMREKDAEFVVRCVVAACGIDPEIVSEEQIRRKEEHRKEEAEEQKRQEEEGRKREAEERKRQEEERRKKEAEERKQRKRKKLVIFGVTGAVAVFLVVAGIALLSDNTGTAGKGIETENMSGLQAVDGVQKVSVGSTDAFKYTVFDDHVRIDKYVGDSSNVVIPSKIEGEIVTRIGKGAFEGCLEVTDVTMPDSITSIGDDAFSGCEKLANFAIPKKVTEIGAGAFAFCRSLTYIEIPPEVKEISVGTFAECESLTEIAVILNGPLTTIRTNAFYGCRSMKEITVPCFVSTIAGSAFNECESLSKLWISEQLDTSHLELVNCPNVTIMKYKVSTN